QLLELHGWVCRDFNTTPAADTEKQLDELLAGDSIDFAHLPSLSQTEAISHVAQDRTAALEQVTACNPGFDAALFFEGRDQTNVIEANAACVREAYSPTAVGSRLADVYQAVIAEEPSDHVDPAAAGEAILNSFLRLDRLCPIRVEA
ncbi:MAG: hypothetical protein AAGF31_12685, partial [Planctomycetota bacterium]